MDRYNGEEISDSEWHEADRRDVEGQSRLDELADSIKALTERVGELEADHNKPSFQTDLETLTEKVRNLEEHPDLPGPNLLSFKK